MGMNSYVGDTLSQIYFADPRGRDVSRYMIGDDIYVAVKDQDENHHRNLIDTIMRAVQVVNIRTGQSIVIDLTETGPNTAIFLSERITTGVPGSGAMLEILPDDNLLATYTDPDDPSDFSEARAVIVTACIPIGEYGNRPNPFSINTQFFIIMGCSQVKRIKVEIYDMTGQLISLKEEEGDRLIWDGSDRAGKPLANGIYIYVLTATGEARTLRLWPMKLVILRSSTR
jgi:hypothetical protein